MEYIYLGTDYDMRRAPCDLLGSISVDAFQLHGNSRSEAVQYFLRSLCFLTVAIVVRGAGCLEKTCGLSIFAIVDAFHVCKAL